MAYAFSRKNGLRRHHTPTFPQTCRDVPDGAATMDIKFGRTVRGAIVLMEHFGQYCMVFPKMDMVITTTAEENGWKQNFPSD